MEPDRRVPLSSSSGPTMLQHTRKLSNAKLSTSSAALSVSDSLGQPHNYPLFSLVKLLEVQTIPQAPSNPNTDSDDTDKKEKSKKKEK